MFNNITLKNFRKHTDATFTFGAGLNAIIGTNEAGKSTLVEAVSYALFGSKALRSTLDDAVTYGEPVNSLKVVLTFCVEGVSYKLSRGKSGCELIYDGGAVTGQNEVSNFVAKLLGFDRDKGDALVFSGQNSIRGTLEKGPTAAAELIEALADFNQIDNLVELMQHHLTLGSSATLEARKAQAVTQLDELTSAPAVNLSQLQKNLDGWLTTKAGLDEELAALQASASKVNTEYEVAKAKVDERSRAVAAVESARAALSRAENAHHAAVKALNDAKIDYDIDERISSLRDSAEAQKSYAGVLAVHREFLKHAGYSGAVFEGTEQELEAYIDKETNRQQELVTKANALQGRVDVALASLQVGSCTLCGKDVSEVPEVVASNKKYNDIVAACTVERKRVMAESDEMTGDLRDHRVVLKEAKPIVQFALRGHPQVKADMSTTPPTLSWIGPDMSLPADGNNYAALIEAEKLKAENVTRLSKEEHNMMTLKVIKGEDLSKAQQNLALLPDVDVGSLKVQLDELREAKERKTEEVDAASQEAVRASRVLDSAKSAVSHAELEKDRLNKLISQLDSDMKTLSFNNALLKRVREVRPLLADKVWSLVLGAIAKYFSEMRGTPSKVAKGPEGFTVDGHPVKSLSGSTLDILGLAIRCSLMKMFLPTTSFIVLDEPAHGCDDNRTQQMLAFLSQCGFRQSLLVTHEATTVEMADNLITV